MQAPTLEWKAVPSHIAEGPAEVRHKDGWLVCEVSADSYAKLIAAAPDLLEALTEIAALTVRQQLPLTAQIHELALSALSKAGAMTNTKLWASSDTYETDTGKIVGRSLAEAVAWARENPDEFARTYIWWTRDDDAQAIIVDRDIRDELAYATGEWFGQGDVLEHNSNTSTKAA